MTRIFLMLMAVKLSMAHSAAGFTFDDAVEKISQHEAIEQLEIKARSLKSESELKGSWGDPTVKVTAKNYPVDYLTDEKSPMTGLEFGVSTKIAMTTKYGHIEKAFTKFSDSAQMESQNKKQKLLKKFWTYIIDTKKIEEEIKIFNENLNWMEKILKVSNRLYSNGKISQQALLDIQIRKSELEANISNKQYELLEQDDRLKYLFEFKTKLNRQSVPWKILETGEFSKDYNEEILRSLVEAKEHLLTASQLSYIPDLTLNFGYTQRSSIDNLGDFVTAAVTFPIPISRSKYSAHSKAAHDKLEADRILKNYRKYKETEANRLKHVTTKIEREIEILNTRTLQYAVNSREITSKSYSLGDTSYIELLQSELKLQRLRIKKTILTSRLLKNRLDYKFLVGGKLYE